MIRWLRSIFCRHRARLGPDLIGPRGEDGKLDVRCFKCRRIWHVSAGLDAPVEWVQHPAAKEGGDGE